MESESMLTPRGKYLLPGKNLLRGGSNPRRCVKQGSEPNALLTTYSGPSVKDYKPDQVSQNNPLFAFAGFFVCLFVCFCLLFFCFVLFVCFFFVVVFVCFFCFFCFLLLFFAVVVKDEFYVQVLF